MNKITYTHKKTGMIKIVKVSQTHAVLEDQKYYGHKIHSVASANKKMYADGYVRA